MAKVVLGVCSFLERRRLFSLFFSQETLLALLRKHGKDEQAASLIRGGLTELNLQGTPIGDDGAEIIAVFLRDDETVRKVLLYSCNIGPRGVEAIAEVLKYNKTVEHLNLNHNQIGDKGAETLVKALASNVWIKSIRIVYGSLIAPETIATLKYMTKSRNGIQIPAVVRRACLYLIAARRTPAEAGTLSIFPKEIVKLIAMQVWATRKDPIWIEALSESELTGRSAGCCIQ